MAGPGFGFTVLSFLLVIGPLVFIHELGHYLVGRWFGVHAETFSIGFGPEMAHWTDKRGTRWRVGALPLGGYVRFAGDMGVASEPDPKWLEMTAQERNRCFHAKPVWQRALIVFAGPFVNLLFASLILSVFAFSYGENVTPTQISGTVAESPAARAGLRSGDQIVAIDGRQISRFSELGKAVAQHLPGDKLKLDVRRGEERFSVPLTIGTRIERDRFGNEYRLPQIGVLSAAQVRQDVSLFEAPLVGLGQTRDLIVMMADGLGKLLTGRVSIAEMGGPLKIAQFSGEKAAEGPIPFITFIALVSINLGFINLLPIPMLDGGHLLFYGVEAIQRKPVSPRVQEIAFRSGLALLLGLMLLVTFNDLASFGLFQGLSRLIG